MDPIIPQPSEQLPVPERKHFLNKKFAITFAILLLLGAGAYAGIWYWQNQQLAQEVAPTFTPRSSPSATPNLTEPVVVDCPTTYTDDQYGFQFNCVSGYSILEISDAIRPYRGWPHALLLLQCDPSLCQTYAMAVEVWDTNQGFKDLYKRNPDFSQKIGDKFVTIEHKNGDPKIPVDIQRMIASFRVVDAGVLTGHVTIGPNCPVEQVGNPCTPSPQAYTSRQVMVYKADGATLVTTQNFDTKGNYNITLPVGTYVIKSKTSISTTVSVVGTVIIKNGQTSTLNFNIDTGIR